MREKDRQILDLLVAAKSNHQDLAELIDFYIALYTVQFEAKARIDSQGSWRDQVVIQDLVAAGEPQITFDGLGVESTMLAWVAQSIAQVLTTYRDGWAEMGSTLAELQPEPLDALAREVYEQPGRWLTHQPSPLALAELAVELALVPYVEEAAETVAPKLDLTVWRRPYCPMCGAAPDLSILGENSGERYLVCSRCDSQWPYARLTCPFCAEPGNRQLTYYPSEDEVYRLYVCDSCKHYLKAVDLRKARGGVVPLLERVLTAAMDIAAQNEGYAA